MCISEAEAGCPCSDCEHCSELSAIAGGDDCISPEDWDAYIDGSSDREPPPFEDVSGGDECISREDFDAAFVVDQDSLDWDSFPGGMTNDNCLDRNEFADVWSNADLGFGDHGGQDGSGSHYPAFEDLDADGDLCISEAEAGCPCSSEGSEEDCDRCSELSAIAGGDDCISPEDWDAYIDGSSDREPPPFEDVSGGDECISREDFDAAFVVDQDSLDWDSFPGGMTNDNCLDRNEFADVWSNADLGFGDHGGQDGSGSHYPAFEDLDADGYDSCR